MVHAMVTPFKGTPEEFCVRHWPLLQQIAQLPSRLQVATLGQLGLGHMAAKVETSLLAPTTEFGAEVSLIVKRMRDKDTGPTRRAGGDSGNFGGGKNRRGVCRRCGARASKPFVKWFETHNKTCK
jgi:hypothetical protein